MSGIDHVCHMFVMDDLELRRLELSLQRRQIRFDRPVDINRRLTFAVTARRKLRAQLAPGGRAFIGAVIPM
jgi:hypothetical protein